MIRELHIKIYEQDGQYLAVAAPDEADATRPVQLVAPAPVPAAPEDLTLQNLQNSLLNLRYGQGDNDLAAVGRYLFQFLFGPEDQPNDIYRRWRDIFIQSQQVEGMRTILHLESELLIGLPWELLCNSNGRYLAFLPNPQPHTLTRQGWKPDDLSLPPVKLPGSQPLRVLLVICHRPEDDSRIMGPDEALQVDAALFKLRPWEVDLKVLVRPRLQETIEWCAGWQPHVFHYVGHGDFDGKVSYLKFYEPGRDDNIPLDPGAMANFFRGGAPRLVVLNACRSGQVGSGEQTEPANQARATRNLCKVLTEGGVPAVIAMQADIAGQAAADLMGHFYRKLTEGVPLDLALTHARRTYFEQAGLATREWDWALPALYLADGWHFEDVLKLDARRADALVVKPATTDSDRYKRQLNELQLRVRIQVGRDREQADFERSLLNANLQEIAPVTLLYGETAMGKTSMLYWLSEGCARRGRHFIYADFGQAALDYWESLRLIRDGRLEAKVSGIHLNNPLNPDITFNVFNHALNSKLVKDYAAQNPVAPEANTPVKDMEMDKNPATALANLGTVLSSENPLETINEAFWTSLARAAEPEGLLIFLDHVDKMFTGEVNQIRNYIVNRVLDPVSHPKAAKVRLVLAIEAPSYEVDPLGPPRAWDFLLDQPQIPVLKLAGLAPEELHWLARLWARRYFISYGPPYLKERKLTPGQIDEYVSTLLNANYLRRPQRPGRLIDDLLNRDNINDFLAGLGGK